MKTTHGLKVRVEEWKPPSRVAVPPYLDLDEHGIYVRIEPQPRSATFVRTASVHFDLESSGELVGLEILGPLRDMWKISDLSWPKDIKVARIRFREPEQCEESTEEIFQTNKQGDILRILFSLGPSSQYVEPASGLAFGIDEADELVDIWIRGQVWTRRTAAWGQV